VPPFQTSPGLRDILPPESARRRAFVDTFAGLAGDAGYGEVVTPLLEDYGVFTRVGDATELVQKEMYRFSDNGGRDVAIRPEFTAAVCRAFAEHRPATPWKVWCGGPLMRYERPQRGRYRQFEQVNLEVLGSNDPMVDVEVIALGWRFFQRLGLRRVTLLVNSLGTPDERARYVELLRRYFTDNLSALSDQSTATLARNPLRVLDSKRPEEAELIAGAPPISDVYESATTAHFEAVCSGLELVGIPYTIAPRLVRGLDYYVSTTFEFAGGTLESAQNALGGGGRYDGLVEALGGPPTPGIGFALGVDRTLLACDDEEAFPTPADSVEVFVVDTTGGAAALAITEQLRAAGVSAARAFDNRSMKAQMKAADRSGAHTAVIVGPDELDAGTVVVRPLREGGEQASVDRGDLVGHLNPRRRS
jgi:histidyl-tRNA synthetase